MVCSEKKRKLKHHPNTYLWLLAIWAFPFILHGQEEGEIRKIVFSGNHYFSDKELSTQISLNSASWFGRTFLKKKASYFTEEAFEMSRKELIHFYQTQGILNVEVMPPIIETKGRKKKLKLTINLSEGFPITIDSVALSFQEKPTVDFEKVKSQQLKATKGVQFRDALIWDDQDLISRYLANHGYPYATVTPAITVDTAKNQSCINWQINPGTKSFFGMVSTSGNKRTPERLILRQLAFKTGELYSQEKLRLSQQQIYQLGTFRVASLRAQMGKEQSDTIPVQIIITEAPTTTTRLGVGYGREDQLRGFIDFQVLNFTGGARRLNLYFKHSAIEPYHIKATLTQPAAFSPNSTLSFSPSLRKLKEPGFELLTYGANLLLLQKITEKTTGSINLYYDQVDLDTTSLARDLDLDLLAKSYSKSGITAGFLYEDAEPRFDPASGWSIAVNSKINSVIFPGKYPFVKYLAEIKHYHRAGSRIILALKIKAGSVQPVQGASIVPVEERFFAGGSRSVKGWARQELGPADTDGVPIGGNSLLEFSFEPRIKIIGPLSLIVFMDAGNVWLDSNTFLLNELRFASGAGIRLSTPIGPIGVDVARPVFDVDNKWQFHLNIGHAF